MKKRRFLMIMSLALALVAVSWGIGRAGANSRTKAPPDQTQTPHEITITDAAGRVHKLMTRLTPAQRKAAAERRKASRAPISRREVQK
jgi:hypothetical protein